MLRLPKTFASQKGLDWAFCDTDSMAIAKPDEMDQAEFLERAQSICEWFSPLNPTRKRVRYSKLKTRIIQFRSPQTGSKFEPLYCYCISAKRYALFNVGKAGEIIIRKASAQGLGNTSRPMKPTTHRNSIPTPSVTLNEIGVERWHYDLWYKIIRAALDGHPDQVDLSYHDGLEAAGREPLRRHDAGVVDMVQDIQCGP